MMRSPWRIATAVRDSAGKIRVKSRPFISRTRRSALLGKPVARGAIGLFEAMSIGMEALTWSSEVAGEEEGVTAGFWNSVLNILVIILAFALGIGLFMVIPYFVAGLLPTNDSQVIFHLFAGTLRILILLAYMWSITLIPDIRSVLRYHGAEHKSIQSFERGGELTVADCRARSRFHPRCGTSFLILAAVLTMVGFMLLDSALVSFFGDFRGVFHRIAVHLPLLPLIAGLSYEVLRIVERNADKPSWRPLILPGFWLQRITTNVPGDSEIEVAIAALRESLRQDEERYEGPARESLEEDLTTASESSAD